MKFFRKSIILWLAPRRVTTFFMLGFVLALGIFIDSPRAKADGWTTLETVPDGYALVGIGFGSDDHGCWLNMREGQLTSTGVQTPLGGYINNGGPMQYGQRCYAGGGDDNDPIPIWVMAGTNQYFTGWRWGIIGGGGSGWGGGGYNDGSPVDHCVYQAYRQINPATAQLEGPILGKWGDQNNGDCEARGYASASDLKAIFYVSDIRGNSVDPDPSNFCGGGFPSSQCTAPKDSFAANIPPSNKVITGIMISLAIDGDAIQNESQPRGTFGVWPPPLPQWDAVPVSDTIPGSFTVNETKTGGFGITMRNTGSSAWPANLQALGGSSGSDCTATETSGYPAPNVNNIGASCTTNLTLSSSQFVLQHTGGSFGVSPPAAQFERAGSVTVTSVNVDDWCYDSDSDTWWVCGSFPGYDYSYGGSWSVGSGTSAPFYITSMTAPGTPSPPPYTEAWRMQGAPTGAFGTQFTKDITVGSPIPPSPTNVVASCPTPGTSYTVSWIPVSGYDYYYVRIYDTTAGGAASWVGPATFPGSSSTWNGAIPGHSYTYWVHTTVASGNPFSAAVPPATYTGGIQCVGPASIQVNSISTAIVGSRKNGQLPILGQGASAYVSTSCPANSLMCGVRSGGTYANSLLQPGQTIMANQPLCCSITSAVGVTGFPTQQIDYGSSGGPAFTCPANQVVMGDYGGSSGQLDRGWCQQLSGSLQWQTSRATTVVPLQRNTDYYCPAGSLVVGFQNAWNKNDSVDRFVCAPIEGLAPDVAKYTPVPSSWDFSIFGSDDPCTGHGGLCNVVQSVATYTDVQTGEQYLVGPNFPYPTSYSLKDVGQAKNIAYVEPFREPVSFFSALRQKFMDIAHAFTVSNRPGGPSTGPLVATAGNTINFVIEWQPNPTCSPSSPTVPMGSNVTFTGDKGNNISYTWDAPGSTNPGPGVPGNPTFTTNWGATFGTKTVTVHSGGGTGTCTVEVKAPPPVCAGPTALAINQQGDFTASSGDNTYVWSTSPAGSPSAGGSGGLFRVGWGSTGAKTVTVTSAGQPVNCPPVNVQDLVSCRRTNASGATITDTAINVGDRVYFKASGGTGNFSWSTVGGSPPSGSGSSLSIFNTSYPLLSGLGWKTITVRDAVLASNSCPINVKVENVYCDYFRAVPKKIIVRDPSRLEWQCHNATNGCTITADTGIVPSFTYQDGVAQTLPINPLVTTKYTMTCLGTPIAVEIMPQVQVEVVRPHGCEDNPFAPECLE